ncbi:threonine aldolase [Desulfobaculum xiamenense]|uniref:Threonine aldolase n=1 Tax=Desulfobaculum xiamenense TaxID=995050 RepID=A0A846QU89_9BACT|nr:low specificity L-threonine aldolase [Desulfobaculum xiamenense]NJB69065.1 threonine aldolase [Desulfobaculum xiamenense]
MLGGKTFASDNNSGVHPRVMEALTRANAGHCVAYGDDPITASAQRAFRDTFGPNAHVFFVYNGTGANVSALSAMRRSFHGIICADCAHANVDECGAPECVSGSKLLPVPSVDGRITPEGIAPKLHHLGFQHSSQPRVVTLTQATEFGTVYSLDDIRAIADFAHDHGLLVHMDGARLANAAAALGCSLADISVRAGVDALSFGGTKNGLMFGEAVVLFDSSLVGDFPYVRKQCMQLHSKMRFIAAQFEAYLTDGLWLDNARSANAMARLLADSVRDVPGLELTCPVETNAVFARIPREAVEPLQKRSFFYVWDEETVEVRWMTSFDTTPEDVSAFAADIRDVLGECL